MKLRFTSRPRRHAPAEEGLHNYPIVQGIEHFPVFVLREEADKDLIALWNLYVSDLSDLFIRRFPEIKVTSIHLFRVGQDELSSRLTIIVNTVQELDMDKMVQMESAISSFLGRMSMTAFPRGGIAVRHPLQIMFKRARLRRSLDSHSLPPICQPRNRQFSPTPGTGSSIGIAESFGDTATLGCYLLIDDTPMVLTVNHLIPTASSSIAIAHISQQDCFEKFLVVLDREMKSIADTEHICELCLSLEGWGSDRIHEFAKRTVSRIFKGDEDPFLAGPESWRCPIFSTCLSQGGGPVDPLAELYLRSDKPFRWTSRSSNEQREMDWAVFRVIPDRFSGLSEHFRRRHREMGSLGGPNELRSRPVKPGAFVKSLGRTSGYQIGQISTTLSIIFHGNYVTEEWCVIKRSETPLDAWIEGGIGVEGDSGALIVDEETDAVYGMLWGRTGDSQATATIFTPMTEVLLDIQNKTGKYVRLLEGQKMPRRDVAESSGTTAEAVPLPISPREESAPIFASDEEKTQDDALEISTPSSGSIQQHSAVFR